MRTTKLIQNQNGISLVGTIIAMGLSTLLISALVSASNLQVRQLRTVQEINTFDTTVSAIKRGISRQANCAFSFQGASIQQDGNGIPLVSNTFNNDVSTFVLASEDPNNLGNTQFIFGQQRLQGQVDRPLLGGDFDRAQIKIIQVISAADGFVRGELKLSVDVGSQSYGAVRDRIIGIDLDLDAAGIVTNCSTAPTGLNFNSVQDSIFINGVFDFSHFVGNNQKQCNGRFEFNDEDGLPVPIVQNLNIVGSTQGGLRSFPRACTGTSCGLIDNASGIGNWDTHCRTRVRRTIENANNQFRFMEAFGAPTAGILTVLTTIRQTNVPSEDPALNKMFFRIEVVYE